MPREKNIFLAEWFGHRVYPTLTHSAETLTDWQQQRCPFLSRAEQEPRVCIKKASSKGVCTISARSNGPRQDWVACPYRLFDPAVLDGAARRMFDVEAGTALRTHAGPTLADPPVRARIKAEVAAGDRVLVYFNKRLGGEIALGGTARSPEMSFDVTFVEVLVDGDRLRLGRFAILEVQTMDFHGKYKAVLDTLTAQVRDYGPRVFAQLEDPENRHWLSNNMEGPNIANVVKRTFYQLFFKFAFGADDRCAGAALAIPEAVWDSWRSFLAAPELTEMPDGTFRLSHDGEDSTARVPAWIYVVAPQDTSDASPNPLEVRKVIGTSSAAIAHLALVAAPEHARDALLAETGIYRSLRKRVGKFWPKRELAADF